MVTNAKKILITTERRELLVIRRFGERRFAGFCSRCSDEVEWLSFDAAISTFGLTWQQLIDLAEHDEIHSVQSAAGHLLICERSMSFRLITDGRQQVRNTEEKQ